MSYDPTVWVDGETPLTAERLNRLEAGVVEAHALAEKKYRAPVSKAQFEALLKRVEALEEA